MLTTFFTTLILYIGDTGYHIPLSSQKVCGEALMLIHKPAFQQGLVQDKEFWENKEVWAQCVKTNRISQSMRPRSRND